MCAQTRSPLWSRGRQACSGPLSCQGETRVERTCSRVRERNIIRRMLFDLPLFAHVFALPITPTRAAVAAITDEDVSAFGDLSDALVAVLGDGVRRVGAVCPYRYRQPDGAHEAGQQQEERARPHGSRHPGPTRGSHSTREVAGGLCRFYTTVSAAAVRQCGCSRHYERGQYPVVSCPVGPRAWEGRGPRASRGAAPRPVPVFNAGPPCNVLPYLR